MRPPTDGEIVLLLASKDPKMIKRGLQRICDAIEQGRRVDLDRDLAVYRLIASLKNSDDVLVRRWLYKLIGLLRVPAWSAWLSGQVGGRESDKENLTWAYAAFASLEGLVTARRRLDSSAADPDLAALLLAEDYFRVGPPLDRHTLERALTTNDELTHQWLSLRRGRDPSSIPAEVMRELASGASPHVSEYAIWSVHRDPHGRLLDLPMHPADMPFMAPNVRRWYARVLVKDRRNLLPYADLVTATMSDAEPSVREGLALGLADIAVDKHLANEIGDWVQREKDELVRLALGEVVRRNRTRHPWMPSRVSPIGEASDDTSEANGSRSPAAKIFVPTPRRLRSQPTLNALPVIEADSPQEVYVLGSDTVDFSKRTDRQQYTIFRDLLDALRHEELISRQDAADIAILPTGDGIFVCLRGAANRLTPLHVAIRLNREFQELRNYRLRFGVNAGPATWITMRGGGSQVISHAVNWAARVMSAAGGGQVFVSDTYYRTHVAPAVDEFPGVEFSSIEGHATKHGEPLPVWQALLR